MGIQVIPLIIVLVYLLGLLLVGYLCKRFFIKTSTDFLLAGRRLGVFFVAVSLAANNVGGGSTTGVASRAFAGWGLSAGWYVLAASIGVVPLAYFAPRIRRTLAHTIPEVIRARFGHVAGTSTAVLNIISLFCLTASQILASGTVVATLVGIPLNVSILISGAIILCYTVLGGLMADAISDLIQWFIIFFGLLITMFFVVSGAGGFEALAEKLPAKTMSFTGVGAITIISLMINYFCTFLSGPEMISRFYSAKDEKAARDAAWVSAILMGLLAFIPAVIGLVALAMNPGLDDGKGTSALMWATTNYAPQVIVGLVAASIISATMSSADSNLLCASTMFVKDIYQQYIDPDIDDKKIITLTRISNVVVGLVSMFVALFRINLVTLNLFAFALRSSGPFAAYGLGLVWKDATRHSGLVSIICGSVAAVAWQLAREPFGILAIVFGCAVGVVSFCVTVLIEKGNGAEPAPSPFPKEG
ncbi:MAG: sodium:solute symporter family protein [Treponema sp.]|jgi:SSS family solute:Na+ symporter|nr:sodium:solute symporter family protein [Treponema sp.]